MRNYKFFIFRKINREVLKNLKNDPARDSKLKNMSEE